MELDKINEITEKIIGCAIEVHRHLGPGLLEATYKSAMCIELQEALWLSKHLHRHVSAYPRHKNFEFPF